jgi:3-methyladenine DNA glycosylase AlkD
MNAQQVLAQLRKLGKPNTARIYARHGVAGPCYGVNYGDLKPLVKKIGRNQDVAAALWSSGIHDARLVATMIAEPEKMTRAQVESWLDDCTNYPITDAVAGVAAQMPGSLEMARAWIEREGEWITSAGWNVVAVNGSKGRLTEQDVDGMLEKIERAIHTQPNRTRHAMNNVLIGIGGSIRSLTPRALAVAKAIGTVKVDHGETGCQTPDAAVYIAKVIARRIAKQAAPAKPAGGKMAATSGRVSQAGTKVPKKRARSAKATSRKPTRTH